VRKISSLHLNFQLSSFKSAYLNSFCIIIDIDSARYQRHTCNRMENDKVDTSILLAKRSIGFEVHVAYNIKLTPNFSQSTSGACYLDFNR
jgi:hypothetical protein